MNFLKKLFGTPKNEEMEYLKARIIQAEELLSQISEDPYTKISIRSSFQIWDFLHPEETNKKN
jgi:hypothetical protein